MQFSLQTLFLMIEFFLLMIFPVMMFANEFDWQRFVPELKYTKKWLKIFIMALIYFCIVMLLIIIEAVKSAM